jgi:hypothetical protein
VMKRECAIKSQTKATTKMVAIALKKGFIVDLNKMFSIFHNS